MDAGTRPTASWRLSTFGRTSRTRRSSSSAGPSPCNRNRRYSIGAAPMRRSPTRPRPTISGRAALNDLEQAIRLENPGDPVLARDQTNRGRLLDARAP